LEAGLMSYSRAARFAICLAVLGAVLVGPATGASASDASIKQAIKTAEPGIIVAEGEVVSGLGQFKKTGNPAAIQQALTNSIGALSSLKSNIAAQTAQSPKVKKAKAKLEKGLSEVVLAYKRLKTAIGEHATSKKAAKAEAKKALKALKKASTELIEGFKLLKG
jgi:hypothetical protein